MVILSVDSDDMRQQLMEHNIEWYEIKPGNRGYFNQSDVISKMDEKVLYKFDTDFWLKNSLVCTDYKNWYRTDYYSDENEKLIENMKKGDSEALQNWLSALYKSVLEKLDDELFINRPGMRLIYNLIKREQNQKLNIIDFGCGHGELIKKYYNDKMNVLGIELSKLRSDYLRAEGIKCINSDLCNTGISDKSHNVAICQEVLEHVANPLLVMNEINRVLDMDSLLFITVPVGKYCDCSTHVRHFNQDLI